MFHVTAVRSHADSCVICVGPTGSYLCCADKPECGDPLVCPVGGGTPTPCDDCRRNTLLELISEILLYIWDTLKEIKELIEDIFDWLTDTPSLSEVTDDWSVLVASVFGEANERFPVNLLGALFDSYSTLVSGITQNVCSGAALADVVTVSAPVGPSFSRYASGGYNVLPSNFYMQDSVYFRVIPNTHDFTSFTAINFCSTNFQNAGTVTRYFLLGFFAWWYLMKVMRAGEREATS